MLAHILHTGKGGTAVHDIALLHTACMAAVTDELHYVAGTKGWVWLQRGRTAFVANQAWGLPRCYTRVSGRLTRSLMP